MAETFIVSVDLASKFSAFCYMDKDGQVLEEANTGEGVLDWWVRKMVAPFSVFSEYRCPEALLIEDLPHGVPYRTVVRDVCRIQGRILHQLEMVAKDPQVLFVQPQLWQRHFDGVYRHGATGAAEAAAKLGYVPPDLTDGLHGPERAVARKLKSDHIDSFLQGRWFIETYRELGSTEAILEKEKRLQRYVSTP